MSNTKEVGSDNILIEGNVNHRIQVVWLKWIRASSVLCDTNVLLKLKEKFYRTAVRHAILYETKYCVVKN